MSALETRILAIVKECGLTAESVRPQAEDALVINYVGNVTYEALDQLSKAFQTTRISFGIDTGCESDPSVEPYVIVWNPVIPKETPCP